MGLFHFNVHHYQSDQIVRAATFASHEMNKDLHAAKVNTRGMVVMHCFNLSFFIVATGSL